MVRKAIREICCVILFILIGALLFFTTDRVLRIKSCKQIDKYYTLEHNIVDVLFVGSSHCYRNINPAVLYEQDGIASYVLGTASQPIWNSYYFTVEALKTQKPKLIVIDCYKVAVNSEYADSAITIKALSGMHYSKNRIDAVKASVENPKEWIEYFIGLPMYHNRYQEVTVEDYGRNYGNEYYEYFLGFLPIDKPIEETIPDDLGDVTQKKEISVKNKQYLDKIINLADKNDIELLFVITPFCGKAERAQKYYNTLAEYLHTKGVPFVNGNLLYDELQLDGETDFGKGNHLSHIGADKYSAFLSTYLKEHYELPDRRGNKKYARWQKNVEWFQNVGDSSGTDMNESE